MSLMRSFFIALSTNSTLRRFMENNAAGRRLSSRFVAGMELEDALRVTAQLNQQGISVTLDALGESVSNETEAQAAADIYHNMLDAIAQRRLNANVSVKLTQMGLELSPALAEGIAQSLTEHARETNNFVRIDMEGANLTQITLDIVHRTHSIAANRGHIGIVMQAYLYRTEADIEQLIASGIRVRLCKGAYKEPANIAFPLKSDVDTNYVKLAGKLLSSPIYHGIATHHEEMIAAVKRFAEQNSIPPSHFEFQMLYGIRRDLQRELVRQGYNVRVYVPFGREWYPYFMRRLAERPANAIFILKNLLHA